MLIKGADVAELVGGERDRPGPADTDDRALRQRRHDGMQAAAVLETNIHVGRRRIDMAVLCGHESGDKVQEVASVVESGGHTLEAPIAVHEDLIGTVDEHIRHSGIL